MLSSRFFGQVDCVLKEFLMPVMLEKQRVQINQSVYYDIFRITKWQHLIKVRIHISRSCLNLRIDGRFMVNFMTNISIFFIS